VKIECTPKEAADFIEELRNRLKEFKMVLSEEDLEEIQEMITSAEACSGTS
jgi:molecular chaperone DnaK (HSP70)